DQLVAVSPESDDVGQEAAVAIEQVEIIDQVVDHAVDQVEVVIDGAIDHGINKVQVVIDHVIDDGVIRQLGRIDADKVQIVDHAIDNTVDQVEVIDQAVNHMVNQVEVGVDEVV